MRVRISYTVNVDEDFRMALRHRYGDHNTLATRAEIRQHFEMVGSSMDDDLMYEWANCDEGCQPEGNRSTGGDT